MRQLNRTTFDRLTAFERLIADGVPTVEAVERVQWSIHGAYMALRHVPATPARDELRKELNRLIGAAKRKTLAETHGTPNCYAAGCRCDACRTAHADARRRQREATAPCGTESAYRRHYARGETPCQPCKDAHRAAKVRYRVKEQAAQRARAEAEAASADIERIIRARIAALAPVKSWAARERAAELRLLLAQITQTQTKEAA